MACFDGFCAALGSLRTEWILLEPAIGPHAWLTAISNDAGHFKSFFCIFALLKHTSSAERDTRSSLSLPFIFVTLTCSACFRSST